MDGLQKGGGFDFLRGACSLRTLELNKITDSYKYPTCQLQCLCCVWGASRPLRRTIYLHLKSGFQMGSCQWPEMGSKVGGKWAFGCKRG